MKKQLYNMQRPACVKFETFAHVRSRRSRFRFMQSDGHCEVFVMPLKGFTVGAMLIQTLFLQN